jgi:hypothetical protein
MIFFFHVCLCCVHRTAKSKAGSGRALFQGIISVFTHRKTIETANKPVLWQRLEHNNARREVK